MPNPMTRLGALGQSPWYDYITRDLVRSGELARLVRDEGLRGMTSNPTIFEKAVAASGDYDNDISKLARSGKNTEEIVETLMIDDVRAAADVFRPVYDRYGHGDGTVSIEVAPTLAHDTQGTIAAATRIWKALDRPNVMVKIPGTREGLEAITQCTAQGMNVNITLLFSVDRYREVIDAFCAGLEQRLGAGQPIDQIHSVASFFVSRVDGQTDPLITKAGEQASPYLHRIAIMNAIAAYHLFGNSLLKPRWIELAKHGVKAQRPLWASTSSKDPALPDTYYIEALIAPDTVNTIPPATWKAYQDHGDPHVRITPDTELHALDVLSSYEQLGLGALADRTAHLETDGVEQFAKSWSSLLSQVEKKAGTLAR